MSSVGDPDELCGQVAIVTGASSGLGARFARRLHVAGATVVVAARRLDRLEALAGDLGDRMCPLACDVNNEADRVALVGTTLDRFGRVDILVNNAGINRVVPAEHEPVESFRETLEVNLVAPFHLAQLAGRVMLDQQSGAIVNIASVLALVAGAPIDQAGYCASKAGLAHLTRELSAQWARRGVRVNAIAPGWFASEMTQEMWDDERSIDFVRRHTPIGRHGQPEELDAVLMLLVGSGGSFIHGQTVVVDGGWTIR